MIKHHPRCKVCNSPHRAEIERLLAEGWSSRRIAQWLEEKFGEKISHRAINEHKKRHWNVAKEIKRRAAQKESEELFEQEVQKGLTRLEALRREREENRKLAEELRRIFFSILKSGEWQEINPETFKAMQSLYNTATNQVRYTAAEEYKQLDSDSEDLFAKLLEMISDEKTEGGSE